uniref:SOCS box domain-containing protein n=1 Tax=Trichogramma kaykai TaxID=54128 RepID=A0ABD2W6S0_9HYME
MHVICNRKVDDDIIEIFFKAIDDTQQTVQIDALDNDNRTPLQLAASNFLPHTIDVLLDRGADLSSFVFPTENIFTFGGFTASYCPDCHFKLRLASGTLAVFERLEKRGYELTQNDVLQISKLFANYKLFEKSVDLDKSWYDDEEFASRAKKCMVKPDLSLHDLIQLRPEEASRQLTYSDYLVLARSREFRGLRREHQDTCAVHLCEKLSRGFFRVFALYPFWDLIHKRLPLEICEMIMKHLTNEDVCNIYVAAAG